MPKSWTCSFCDNPGSEMGAYVKLSTKSYAHVACFETQAIAAGIKQGRQLVLDEQEEGRRKEQERRDREVIGSFEALGRCPKCGVRALGPNQGMRREWAVLGEVRVMGPAGRCDVCVREEVQARARARGAQAPFDPTAAQAMQTAATRPVEAATEKKPGEPKQGSIETRIGLIEID